jgi:sulfate adenylyltransferase subunit 1
MIRFFTCGSVDDGKSTLIGRLLHDSKMIFEDQLAAIEKDSKKSGTTGEAIDLALLVDGLQSEREQGITIDVAYRYFSTDKRKFIIKYILFPSFKIFACCFTYSKYFNSSFLEFFVI